MSTRGAAPAPHPLGLRELGAGMRPAAGLSRTGRWRHRGGDKGARPYVSTRVGGAGGEALGSRVAPAKRPWEPGGGPDGELPALWWWRLEGGGW